VIVEEQSCHISSRSDLKRRSLSFLKTDNPTTTRRRRRRRRTRYKILDSTFLNFGWTSRLN